MNIDPPVLLIGFGFGVLLTLAIRWVINSINERKAEKERLAESHEKYIEKRIDDLRGKFWGLEERVRKLDVVIGKRFGHASNCAVNTTNGAPCTCGD